MVVDAAPGRGTVAPCKGNLIQPNGNRPGFNAVPVRKRPEKGSLKELKNKNLSNQQLTMRHAVYMRASARKNTT